MSNDVRKLNTRIGYLSNWQYNHIDRTKMRRKENQSVEEPVHIQDPVQDAELATIDLPEPDETAHD